jgi:Family of unknown function (DUF6444)
MLLTACRAFQPTRLGVGACARRPRANSGADETRESDHEVVVRYNTTAGTATFRDPLRIDEQIRRLEARVGRRDERIAQLERKLSCNSRNSSAPPSLDPPNRPKRGRDRSGRNHDGQPGHAGHGRDLLPACAVDDVIEHWPEHCSCGHLFFRA